METVKNYSSSNLKYLRLTNNIPTEKVANAISKSVNAIYNYETGIRSLSVEDSIKLANFFNVGYGDFIAKDLRIEKDIFLDENHKLETIIMDKSKELTEQDKKKLINIIDSVFDNK